MFKKVIFSFFILIISISLNAQEKTVIENNPNYKFQSEKETTTQKTVVQKSKPVFQPRWSFGGNIGLGFWNGGADILIAPKAYYHFAPQFFTGVGLTYLYSKNSSNYQNHYYDYSSNSFGGSVTLGFRPIQFLQFTAEYEGLNTNYSGYYTDSYWNNALYLGASFVTGNVAFGFQYDVLYDQFTSPYGSAWGPIISFYF